MLSISQPTVSQQLSNLESRLGQKLFTRKSKGVIETDFGRMLNTMLSGTMERLEEVELSITKKESKLHNIISVGISPHIYKTLLCPNILGLGEYVHIKFGTKKELIKDVEEGRLLYAIIPDSVNTFDTLCYKIRQQKLLLVGTKDIDFSPYIDLYQTNRQKAQQWLSSKKWYAHDHNSNFIKIYWLHLFDKQRPSIIPNYVIPNEYEVLFQQSQGSGLSVAFDTTIGPFLRNDTLHTCEVEQVNYRDLSVISNKQKADPTLTKKLVTLLSK